MRGSSRRRSDRRGVLLATAPALAKPGENPAPAPTAAAEAKQPQIKLVSLLAPRQNTAGAAASPAASRFVRCLEGDEDLEEEPDQCEGDENECILSQDFFCTPDYITPEGPQIPNNFDTNKHDSITCPTSPEKSTNPRSKRQTQEITMVDSLCTSLTSNQWAAEFRVGTSDRDDRRTIKKQAASTRKKCGYVSRSAVALRCRVMPPPCIKNPYSKDTPIDLNVFEEKKSRAAGFFDPIVGQDGLPRYSTDFHEIQQIGCGNFSRVYKVLKRIDGCLYAVKQSIRVLRQDMDRRRALMEVQALAALGRHENIVGYYSSWFENEHLYIQMELCDRCVFLHKSEVAKVEGILSVLYQVAKALKFMHERGIAHLDVKPDNIYVKNGVYKLGDFGCATLIDRSLPIEEGDSRYMPQEILNDKYEFLDKVDIFSLGASTYELVRGSPLPYSGPQFSNLREGKIPLLPGYSMQFQNLLKTMMDPDPGMRPSAKEIIGNPIFGRMQTNLRMAI